MGKNFIDIILDEFEDEETVELNEIHALFTPFLAFGVLKKNIFNRLANAGKFLRKKAIEKVKSKALVGKEKLLAKTGKKSAGITYKLQPEQKAFLEEIYKKYGKEIGSEIRDFRNKILAGYQVAKRTIKKSEKIGSTVAGMDRNTFEKALASGRKKIESRGSHFETAKEQRGSMTRIRDRIENLNRLKSDFLQGKKPSYDYARKVYQSFGAGVGNKEGDVYFSKERLRRAYDSIIGGSSKLKAEYDKIQEKGKENLTSADFAKSSELLKQIRATRSGATLSSVDYDSETDRAINKYEDLTDWEKTEFKAALDRYFLSRGIWNELTSGGNFNVYKKTYLSIIDNLLERERKKSKTGFSKMVKIQKEPYFDKNEKKIWKLNPTAPAFSGKISDYSQKITADQFPGAVGKDKTDISIEKDITKEIRKVENELSKKIDSEDWQELKRLRLVNRLISVKEKPENLFKSKPEEEPEEEE
tara:strand:+ start:874 stop:2292 length:1419 start_codon:yes stop_codon:yes gene_type:complete